ncbi:DUF4389 domain-containing protein [Candidatus Nitrosacidococcus tergens]|uniref:Lipase n=1 Tax=Candidatus Nitrosacidococcus tergens TaxID=553981 RepID=A0A7G1QB66_9GAMM|nr:DUF4389 domain-containing protein [Candidatus Nitrosacidococcus tergens]CAB1277185.1 conserved protein of unknown function [Candidatus Nitrosacidococcus tergens]
MTYESDKIGDLTKSLVQNLKNTGFWKRFLFMAIFAAAYTLAAAVVCTIIAFLLAHHLVTGKTNERAIQFARQVSAYIYHVLLYLTYNTEELPFPYMDWPNPEHTPSGIGKSPES